jgi:hypothetical protein
LDITEKLKAGSISVGLYHTAGKGTRLAPLPGAENNNKPGVKLPITVRIGKKKKEETILTSCLLSVHLHGKLSFCSSFQEES